MELQSWYARGKQPVAETCVEVVKLLDKPREESWCLQLLGANTAAAVMMLPGFDKGDGQRTISAGPGKFLVPNACGFFGCELLREGSALFWLRLVHTTSRVAVRVSWGGGGDRMRAD